MKSYIHIYKETRDRIMRGDLKPGTKLPSHRNICEDYAVSIPTVTKAINRLKREGLVSSIRGLGTMVADAPHSGGLVGTKTVVFVSFFPNFIHEVSSYALQEVFQGTDWRINARCTHSNLDWYRDYLIECREYPPAGMIWLPMSPYIYDHTEEMLPHPATKVVMISHEIPGRKYDLVRANGFADGFSLAEFLVDKGYDRDFIFLTEAPLSRELQFTYTFTLRGISFIIPTGHASTHFPHALHFSSITRGISPSLQSKASNGQTSTQVPKRRHPYLHDLKPPDTSFAA